jgi:hypothetical protein
LTEVVRIFAPLLIWLALFSGVYGLHGIGCGLGWPAVGLGAITLHRAALTLAWIAALLAQAALLVALRGPFLSRRPFVKRLSATLAVGALVATGWTLFPVAFASSCG